MGVSINLAGAGFNRVQWRRDLGDVVYSGTQGAISPLCLSLLHPDEADLILFDGEDIRVASPNAEVWVLPVGGIRGVTVKNSPDGIELSMPVLTGARDWEMAAALTKLAFDCGATVDVDGEPVAPGPVDFSHFLNQNWSMSVAMLRDLARQGQELVVPILMGGLHLEISPEQLDSPDLHDGLVAQMKRFGEAHIASTMTVQTQSGQLLHLNVAGGVPTLIERESQGLILHDAPDNPAAMSEPLFDGAPVPTDEFLRVMGERVESAGPRIYVPLFKYSEAPEILSALAAAAAAGNFGAPGGGAGGGAVATVGVDHAALARGPVLVFLMVAGADGKVDEKEIGTFQGLVANSELAPGAVFGAMLRNALGNFEQIFTEITAADAAPPVLFLELLQALEACPPEEGMLARQGLYALGHAIASASGGGFMGLGSKISRSEKKALQLLQKLLAVNPDEFIS